MQDDLTSILLGEEVDHGEFLSLIGLHYGIHGSTPDITPDNAVIYPASKCYSMKVVCKSGRIKRIEKGPGLTEEDLETVRNKIRAELVETNGNVIAAEIIFSSKPVNGYFRSATDEIQLLPAPPEAPRPPGPPADYPFVIEFPVKRSRNGYVTNKRRLRCVYEWAWTLSTLLRHPIKVIGRRTRHMWAIVSPGASDSQNPNPPNWVQEFYMVKGFDGFPSEFTPPGCRAIKTVSVDEYYSDVFIEDDVVLPDSLNLSIQSYVNLSPDDRAKFLRAAHMINVSSKLWAHQSSLYYNAFIQAIEALAWKSTKSDPCPQCGKDRSPGPTKRFRDFVERYCQGNDVEKDRFYRLRSTITHGQALLQIDESPWNYSLNSTELAQRKLYDSIGLLTRRVATAWLNDSEKVSSE